MKIPPLRENSIYDDFKKLKSRDYLCYDPNIWTGLMSI